MPEDRLQEILDHKREEIAARKKGTPIAGLMRRAEEAPPVRGFARALAAAGAAVIAEIKRRSPSAGTFREDFDPLARAEAYQQGGACCLSVLADEKYFGGSLDLFEEIRRRVKLPCLVKDFIIDRYQLFEARARGADAYLLIARALDDKQAAELLEVGGFLGMDCLFEIHDEREARLATELGAPVVGINNRDLAAFTVDLAVSERLAPLIPDDRIKVALSGVKGPEDARRLARSGIRAFLVGEALSRSDDPAAAVSRILAAAAGSAQ